MGYSVYWQQDYSRWAGYGVPAECDWLECESGVYRGLAYACENHVIWSVDDDSAESLPGCMMFFCREHLHEDHEKCRPKWESARWIGHVLSDESWAEWRHENPALVDRYEKEVAS